MTQIMALEREQLLACLAVLLPAPTAPQIELECQKDRLANPHGESHKPHQRDVFEIMAYLRVKAARSIMNEIFLQSQHGASL